MTTAPDGDYSIVFLGRLAGHDRPVGQALARAFGFKEDWGMRVVGVSPCVLLAGLTAEQADEIHAVLAEVEASGSKFQIEKGIDPGLTKLDWPAPPRLRGRLVSEYGRPRGVVLTCPHCGQAIELSVARAAAEPASAEAFVPAGQPAQPLPVAGSADFRTPPVPQAPIQLALPGFSVGGQQVSAATGSPMPGARPSGGAGARPPLVPPPMPLKPPTAGGTPPIGRPPVIIASVQSDEEALDELEPIGGIPAKAPPARPAPPMAPAQVRLPEVPLIDKAPGPAAPARPGGLPGKSRPGPMTLDDFEAGLAEEPEEEDVPEGAPAADPITGEALEEADELPQVPAAPAPDGARKGSGPRIPSQSPAKGAVPRGPAAPRALPSSGARAKTPSGTCSVLVPRSGNPRLGPLLAEIRGISLAEAQKLASRPIISVARDVSHEEADSLKRRFEAIGVTCQVRVRR